MKDVKAIFLFLIIGLSSVPGFSQSAGTINLKEIHQKKIRKFIEVNAINRMQDFSSIHCSWKKGTSESTFHVNEKSFYLKDKLSDVWESYRNADLARSLNRRSVRFGLLLSKRTNGVTYTDNSSFPGIDTGQVYFLKLRLMKGIFSIPVAFEIINIDPQRQIMEFSYLDNNKTQGKQTLQFFDNGNDRTRIVHRSYFKSDSKIRDNLLYPHFHKKFIKTFHRNMRQMLTI